jgi:hypothetical protein
MPRLCINLRRQTMGFDLIKSPVRFSLTWTLDGIPNVVRLAIRLAKVRQGRTTAEIVEVALRAYLEREEPDLLGMAQGMMDNRKRPVRGADRRNGVATPSLPYHEAEPIDDVAPYGREEEEES